jgi:hypothetical protein
MLDLNAGQWSIIIRVSSLGLFLLGIPWRPYAVEDGDERGQEYGRTPISRHPQNPFSIRLLLDRESGRRSFLDQSGEYASALRSPWPARLRSASARPTGGAPPSSTGCPLRLLVAGP